MQMIHFIWLVRGLGGLAIGFFIARKLRDFIRSIIIMCIPLKHRISERSFLIQTRMTTLVSILLMIAIAIGLNWGLSKGLTQISSNEITTIQHSRTTPTIPWTTDIEKPVAPKAKTTLAPTPEIGLQSESLNKDLDMPILNQSENLENRGTPPVSKYAQIPESPLVKQQRNPRRYQQRTFEAIPIYYYAQLYAFKDFNKAQTQLWHWNRHSQLPVRIGYIQQEKTPYKVIIGPFRNRQAAISFLQLHHLKGFARPAHQLQIFE